MPSFNLWNFLRFWKKPELPTTELVTADQLRKVCTSLTILRCQVLAILVNSACAKYGVKTKDELHELLANVVQESGEFQFKVENMNYRAQTINKVWPKRFPTIAQAIPFQGKPQELANEVYGSRMGNRPGTDDGWNFRGGGFIGLTGRSMYQAYCQFKGFTSLESTAEYIRVSDNGAMDSAFWFMCKYKNLVDDADRDEFVGIVKEINGGLIGINDRQLYYDRGKKYIV